MKQIVLKLREDKSFGMPKPNSMALVPMSEFIDEVFGDEKLNEFKKLINKELDAWGYNMTHVERIDNSIFIHSIFSGYSDIKIPIGKFSKFIDQLSLFAHFKRAKEKPKEIIFKFDDEWNCKIEIIK